MPADAAPRFSARYYGEGVYGVFDAETGRFAGVERSEEYEGETTYGLTGLAFAREEHAALFAEVMNRAAAGPPPASG